MGSGSRLYYIRESCRFSGHVLLYGPENKKKNEVITIRRIIIVYDIIILY